MLDRTVKLSFFNPSDIDLSVGIQDVVVNYDSVTAEYLTNEGVLVTLGTYGVDPNAESHGLESVTLADSQLTITTTLSAEPIVITLTDSPNYVEWVRPEGVSYYTAAGTFKSLEFSEGITLTETADIIDLSMSQRVPHGYQYSITNRWVFQDRSEITQFGFIRMLNHMEGDSRLSLSDDTITIPPGVYYAEFWSGAYGSDRLLCKLQDIDNGLSLVQSIGSRSDQVLQARQSYGTGHFTVYKPTRIQLIQFQTMYNTTQHTGYLRYIFDQDLADQGIETSVRSEVKLWAIELFESDYSNLIEQTTVSKTPTQLVYASGDNNPLISLDGTHRQWRTDWNSGLATAPYWVVEYPTPQHVSGYELTTTTNSDVTLETAKCPTAWKLWGRNNERLVPDVSWGVSALTETSGYLATNTSEPMSSSGAWRSTNVTEDQWLMISASDNISFNGYSIINETTVGNVQSPKSWALQASVDGISWDDLDTVTDDLDNRSGAVRYFYLPTIADQYQFVRLVITSVNDSGGGYVSIGRFQLHNLSEWQLLQEVNDTRAGINLKKRYSDVGVWDYSDYKFEFTDSTTKTSELIEIALSDVALLRSSPR